MRRYKNASDVLPDALLKQVQRYAAGQTLYFPKDEARASWGERSGARAYYRARNAAILDEFARHTSLEHLAEKHGLTVETIKKIVYGRRG